MLWMILLAQAATTPPQMNRDQSGFVYSAEEARACQRELMAAEHLKLPIWQKQFHDCVEVRRSQVELQSKQRDQRAAAKEAVRQLRAQRSERQASPEQQLDGIEYIEVEARACRMELDALRDAMQAAGGSRGDPNVLRSSLRKAHAKFEECLEELRAEAKRQDQEEEHERRLAREAEARQIAQQLVDKPEARRVDLSGLLCTKLAARQELMSMLTKDKKYSAIGGAVNLSRRAEIQDELAGVDDEIRRVRAVLKGHKATALGCGDARVKAVAECMAEDPPEECIAEPQVRAHVLAAQMLMVE